MLVYIYFWFLGNKSIRRKSESNNISRNGTIIIRPFFLCCWLQLLASIVWNSCNSSCRYRTFLVDYSAPIFFIFYCHKAFSITDHIVVSCDCKASPSYKWNFSEDVLAKCSMDTPFWMSCFSFTPPTGYNF